ncbi:MAG: hypothetical protein ACJA1L_003390, partial [Paracoccaceae bacterium]
HIDELIARTGPVRIPSFGMVMSLVPVFAKPGVIATVSAASGHRQPVATADGGLRAGAHG